MICPNCEGAGKVKHTDDTGVHVVHCGTCQGSGKVLDLIPQPEE